MEWEDFLLFQWSLNHWNNLLTPEEYEYLEYHQLSKFEK